CQQHYNTPLTF
nr:immunoglobulin light chain junction region [Mus musculus]NSL99826.1 immunoglobulin light chain junction region [Mus musculus]